MKTLNEWLREMGYVWIDGQERLMKGMLSRAAAKVQIAQLESEGVIKRG